MNDNRIINGDMRIDQRNASAGGTATNVYTCDRWQFIATQTAGVHLAARQHSTGSRVSLLLGLHFAVGLRLGGW